MTLTSLPSNPVLSPALGGANTLTPEQYVHNLGGEIIKLEGRVFVRLAGSVTINGEAFAYNLIPTNGVLAKASKWRNMAPEQQLILVSQRVNPRAIAALREQISTFVAQFLDRAENAKLDGKSYLKALSQKSANEPIESVLAAIDRRLASALERVEEQRHAALAHDCISLAEYPESFELAHRMKRKFIAVLGPTNSGKSWAATNALAKARSGVYLAPLRLLALENYEKLVSHFGNENPVSLITGDERRVIEGATHIASTVEMLDTRTEVDVVVIDEIQLLSDPERGSAWTAAVCGAPAPVVYLVGALEARAAIESLAKRLDCELEIKILQRKSPLSVLPSAIRKVRNLKKGDAIVAFSRRDVLAWRDQATEAGFSVATVYGNLSPEVRRAQAARFSEGKADIVVGTDAIAMGLNLPISRVVLTTAEKFNGVDIEEISAALAQQISGRAGRFGLHEEGFVAGFDEGTHRTLRSLLQEKVPQVPATGFLVAPTLEHLARLSRSTRETSLANLLKRFVRNIDVLDGFFRPQVTEEQVERASWLDTLPLTLADKFTLSLVPISTRIESLNIAWQGWAKGLSMGLPSLLRPASTGGRRESLQDVEDLCKLYSAYAWLSYRCPEYFPSTAQALERARAASERVDQILSTHNKAQRKMLPKSAAAVDRGGKTPRGKSRDSRRFAGRAGA